MSPTALKSSLRCKFTPVEIARGPGRLDGSAAVSRMLARLSVLRLGPPVHDWGVKLGRGHADRIRRKGEWSMRMAGETPDRQNSPLSREQYKLRGYYHLSSFGYSITSTVFQLARRGKVLIASVSSLPGGLPHSPHGRGSLTLADAGLAATDAERLTLVAHARIPS